MKILFFHPKANVQQEFLTKVKTSPVTWLQAQTLNQAVRFLQLHGKSIDLALIYWEGSSSAKPAAEKLVQTLKKDSEQADLPFILIVTGWSEAQCAAHQQTDAGAHAYVFAPLEPVQVLKMVQAVTGETIALPGVASAPAGAKPPLPPSASSVSKAKAPPPPPVPQKEKKSKKEMTVSLVPLQDGEGEPLNAFQMEELTRTAQAPVLGLDDMDWTTSSISVKAELSAEVPAPPRGVAVPPPPARTVSPPSLSTASRVPPTFKEKPVALPPVPPIAPSVEMPPLPVRPEVPANVAPMVPSSALEDLGIREEPSIEIFIGDTQPEQRTNIGIEQHTLSDLIIPRPVESEPVELAQPTVTRPVNVFPQHPIAAAPSETVAETAGVSSSDLETLKKYLYLREQDVERFSRQSKTLADQVKWATEKLNLAETQNAELKHQLAQQEQQAESHLREKDRTLELIRRECESLRGEVQQAKENTRTIEVRYQEVKTQLEQVKDQLRMDLRKVRVREKELENKLEIAKRDSEALLTSRENKIVELKRKVDLLEFNADLLQEKYNREKQYSKELEDRMNQVAQAMRRAGGILDFSDPPGRAESEGVETNKDVTAELLKRQRAS